MMGMITLQGIVTLTALTDGETRLPEDATKPDGML